MAGPSGWTLTVAADVLLAPVLDGAPRSARVVVATPRAAYAQFEDGALVGVLAPGAVRAPGAVVVPDACLPVLGAEVVVGGGALEIAGRRFRPRRWWDSRVPRVCPPATPPDLGAVPSGVPARELEALSVGDLSPVARLVGLGPGLTPSGDDVLAGALVALGAAGADDVTARLAAAIRPLRHRTTAVSAAFLDHAARGRAVPPLARYVVDLARGRLSPGVVQDLERVGATSGAALAAGVRIGMRIAASAPAAAGPARAGQDRQGKAAVG